MLHRCDDIGHQSKECRRDGISSLRAKDTGSVEMASTSKKPKEGRGKPKSRSSAPVNKKPTMTIGRIAEAAANNEQPLQQQSHKKVAEEVMELVEERDK